MLSNTFFLAYFAKNINMAKLHIFDQNHRLSPLQKSQFFDFLNLSFLLSWNHVFVSKILSNTFFALFCEKQKHGHILTFWPKPWTNPLEKSQFYSLQRIFLFLKYFQTHFFGLFCKKIKTWLTFMFLTTKIKTWQNFTFFNKAME